MSRPLTIVLASLLISLGVFVFAFKPRVVTTPVVVQAASASAPATTESTTTSAPAAILRTWHEVVSAKRLHPATQPLEIPTTFDRAAKFVVDFPVCVDLRGDLWVTNPAAAPFAQTMKSIDDEQTHVVGPWVSQVRWIFDEKDRFVPAIVWADSGSDSPTLTVGGKVIEKGYNFAAAPPPVVWDHFYAGRMGTSAVVLSMANDVAEQTQRFAAEPTLLLDSRGLLAWSSESNQPPARFVDNAWHPLDPADGWSKRVLQLVPLLDGSVIQLAYDDSRNVVVNVIQLDSAAPDADGGASPVDRDAAMKVVARLSDADPSVREAAFDELSRFGAGVLPLLAKVKDDQPAEAQLRIEQLLAGQLRPLLGSMMLEPGPAKVIAHLGDGGSVIKFDAGVVFPAAGERPAQPVAPAYIVFRPGRAVKLLPPPIVTRLELKPQTKFQAFNDEWVISDDAIGPLRLIGSQLMPMLSKEYASFNELVAFDRRGRWLFQDPAQPGKTLIVDPTYVDETPVLPAWEILAGKGTVGWTRDGWPCIQNGGTWALKEEGWQAIGEPPITATPAEPPPTTTATTGPSTTTAPAAPPETPIWTDPDGTRFFGGEVDLRMTSPTGQSVTWPLPDGLAGVAPVFLCRAGERRLFLINAPGRVIRLKQHAPGEAQPFEAEAVFTEGIPADAPSRVWLDRAGRLVFATPSRLVVLFPTGSIPPNIAKMMPGSAK